MRGSFRRRLTALIAVVFVIGGAALLGVQYLLVMRLLEQQVDEQTVETVVQVPGADDDARPSAGPESDGAPATPSRDHTCPDNTRPARFIDGYGIVGPGFPTAGITEDGLLVWAVCVAPDGTIVERALIDTDATPEEQAEILERVIRETTTRTTTRISEEVLRSLALWSVGMLVAFTAVAVTAAWWLSRRSLGRIARITAATRAISHDELDRRLDLPGPADEIKELGDTIDAMLDRIEDAFTRQDRFIAGASHELRTPLTTTRTLLEIPLDQSRFADDVVPAVRGALEANARSERLIAALLTLARSRQTARTAAERTTVTDLRDLTATLLGEREAGAAERQVALGALPDNDSPVPVAADTGLLTLAVGNVLDNALRHNRPGGSVAVRFGEGVSTVWVEVSNDGADLTGTDLDALREPFHRGNRSRLAGEGLGLGLALVDTAATALGGTLQLAARPQGGLTARLILPRATADAGPAARGDRPRTPGAPGA